MMKDSASMITDTITIKPIRLDEWLPDRCLNGLEALAETRQAAYDQRF